METKEQRFEKEVKRVTPKHNIWKNMFHAFWMGDRKSTRLNSSH